MGDLHNGQHPSFLLSRLLYSEHRNRVPAVDSSMKMHRACSLCRRWLHASFIMSSQSRGAGKTLTVYSSECPSISGSANLVVLARHSPCIVVSAPALAV